MHKTVKKSIEQRGSVGRKRTKTAKDAVFTCKPCRKTFLKLTELRTHQKDTGHNNLKKNPKKRAKTRPGLSLKASAPIIEVKSSSEFSSADDSPEETTEVNFPQDIPGFDGPEKKIALPCDWIQMFSEKHDKCSDDSDVSF